VSLLLIISWSVAGLIGAVLAGIVFVKFKPFEQKNINNTQI
jgi:hypothetical protein